MKQENNRGFIGKTELANRYCCCLNTFNIWLKKVEDKIPLYTKKQRLFSPSQVAFLDATFCYTSQTGM